MKEETLQSKLSITSKLGPGDLLVIRSARYIECQQKTHFLRIIFKRFK
jgi:hypothetical protein